MRVIRGNKTLETFSVYLKINFKIDNIFYVFFQLNISKSNRFKIKESNFEWFYEQSLYL